MDFGAGSAGSGRIRLPNTGGAIRWESAPASAFEAEIVFVADEISFTAAAGDTFGYWLGDAGKSNSNGLQGQGLGRHTIEFAR